MNYSQRLNIRVAGIYHPGRMQCVVMPACCVGGESGITLLRSHIVGDRCPLPGGWSIHPQASKEPSPELRPSGDSLVGGTRQGIVGLRLGQIIYIRVAGIYHPGRMQCVVMPACCVGGESGITLLRSHIVGDRCPLPGGWSIHPQASKEPSPELRPSGDSLVGGTRQGIAGLRGVGE